MEWPSNWITSVLEAAGVPVTQSTMTIMRAWYASTPTPLYTNNPIGVPAGTLGASELLNTGYALFATIGVFYRAFAAFSETYQGQRLIADMQSENPYPATWRAIHSLNWPASRTETDYPAALLDLTEASYRESVGASDATQRKTSGMVGAAAPNKNLVIEGARNLATAGQAITGATELVQHLLKNGR